MELPTFYLSIRSSNSIGLHTTVGIGSLRCTPSKGIGQFLQRPSGFSLHQYGRIQLRGGNSIGTNGTWQLRRRIYQKGSVGGKKARHQQGMMGVVSKKDYHGLLSSHLLKNNNVTPVAITTTRTLFGLDLANVGERR